MKSNILEELYLKYHKEVYLYLYSLCKQRETAEDICQDTFVKAMLSLTDKHENFRAWLYIVARNLYFNHSKRSGRETNIDEINDMPIEDDTLENMITGEKHRLLYKAVQKLSPQKREVLTLQYWGGLSQKEIAAVMHITCENVRVLGYRAKKDLKRILEENNYEIF